MPIRYFVWCYVFHCGITTDNAAKIPCLRKEHGGADTEESTGSGNLGDIIDEDDNDIIEHES